MEARNCLAEDVPDSCLAESTAVAAEVASLLVAGSLGVVEGDGCIPAVDNLVAAVAGHSLVEEDSPVVRDSHRLVDVVEDKTVEVARCIDHLVEPRLVQSFHPKCRMKSQ